MRIPIIVAAALLLSACGFRPLYATGDAANGAGAALSRMAIDKIEGPEAIQPVVERAFKRRAYGAGDEAPYALSVIVDEQAERLAVQIDASVTRFNYRVIGDYTLIERATGKRYTGKVTSIASFNIVESQYSTLFAEESAKEKAATLLVEDIERDILLKIADDRDGVKRKGDK
jgi:LPS-assembly lipoprotein